MLSRSRSSIYIDRINASFLEAPNLYLEQGEIAVSNLGLARPNDEGLVFASKPKDLNLLFRLGLRTIGVVIEEEEIQSTVNHENEHVHAALLMGAISIRTGISLANVYTDGVLTGRMCQAFAKWDYPPQDGFTDRETKTILGIAHPNEPSRSDILALEQYGHTVESAGRLAIEHNETYGTSWPMPLSL